MPDPDPRPASREPDRGGFWTTLPGILTGLAALITAIVGLLSLPGESETVRNPPEVATAPANAAGEPASQAAASRSTDPAPDPTAPPGVFAEGRISMRTPDSVDLERGVVGSSPPGYDLYLHCSGVSTCILNAMGSLMTVAGDADGKESCIAALKMRQDQALELQDLRAGQALCVQTTDGHVGRLQLLGLPGPGSVDFEFSYTLWI